MAGYLKSFIQGVVAAGAVLAPYAVYAASEVNSDGCGGLPQFCSKTFPSQLFWLAVILLVFFLAMRGNALPRIGAALEARRQKIDDDLDKAAAHREEAGAVMAAYEKSLAEAADQAHIIQREAAEAIAARAAERRTEVARRLAEETKAAEARILAAKEPVLASLAEVAADIVQEATARLAGVKVAQSDAKAAVKSFGKDGG